MRSSFPRNVRGARSAVSVRRENLDILDIKVAEITRQYMQYIELMTALQWDLTAEYLVIAALLANPSRMLLPRLSFDLEDEDDPRAQLIRRLQDYERFKMAAERLDTYRASNDVFAVVPATELIREQSNPTST
jgi:segregation and condensation protein A